MIDSNDIPIIQIIDNKLVTSSIDVATFFNKQHKNVLQSIEKLLPDLPRDCRELNFQPSTYTTNYGNYNRSLPCYNLARDGFVLLAMGFTGKKALQWKIKYIEAFNAMEKYLKKTAPLEPEPKSAFKLDREKAISVFFGSEEAFLKIKERKAMLKIKTVARSKPKVNNSITTTKDREELSLLVKRWVINTKSTYPLIWHKINKYLGIKTISTLPKDKLNDAIKFVQEQLDNSECITVCKKNKPYTARARVNERFAICELIKEMAKLANIPIKSAYEIFYTHFGINSSYDLTRDKVQEAKDYVQFQISSFDNDMIRPKK